MKLTSVVALLVCGLSIPAFGQDRTSCKVFFQVLRADTQAPEHLRTGTKRSSLMDGTKYIGMDVHRRKHLESR